MKIATWNVNSLKVRLPQVLEWLGSEQPDVLCLQETKLADARFPVAELADAGYRALYHGQPTYNGVAILSRTSPSDVRCDWPDGGDGQARLCAASFGDLRVVNVYVPNGQALDSDKYPYKLQWLERLRGLIAGELQGWPQLLLVGDFNIAPDTRDVYDAAEWGRASSARRRSGRRWVPCWNSGCTTATARCIPTRGRGAGGITAQRRFGAIRACASI